MLKNGTIDNIKTRSGNSVLNDQESCLILLLH